jgi:putative flippase GtrA
MIDTSETYFVEPKIHTPTQPLQNEHAASPHRFRSWLHSLRQLMRFGLVGVMNTLVDLLLLNALLVLFPTTNSFMLLAYNALAYSLGAINSFFMNKYWTFKNKQRVTRGEVVRFAVTTLFGIVGSSGILWLASNMLHPFLVNATVWANASKIFAIAGTVLISYLGMHLWVFVRKPEQH